MHDREDAEFLADHGVEQTVRKPRAQPAANLAPNEWRRLWVSRDCFSTPLHFRNEHRAKTRPLKFVVLRRVVELALGKLVERDAHDSDPRPRVAKHVGGGSRR